MNHLCGGWSWPRRNWQSNQELRWHSIQGLSDHTCSETLRSLEEVCQPPVYIGRNSRVTHWFQSQEFLWNTTRIRAGDCTSVRTSPGGESMGTVLIKIDGGAIPWSPISENNAIGLWLAASFLNSGSVRLNCWDAGRLWNTCCAPRDLL